MKKFIAIAIAVLTVFSFTTVAFAESTTTLTTTVPDAEYTLNIPADQEIPFGATSTDIGNVTATNSKYFAVGKNLKITVTYDDFTCADASTTIPISIIMKGNMASIQDVEIASGDILYFKGKTDGTLSERPFATLEQMHEFTNMILNVKSTDWGKALAGDYTATITFTAEVVAA